jgi:ubiquinone/menaquinone biosynthesis C-methylase UbiE
VDAREQMIARWERVAPGWGKRADRMRKHALPVSVWMVENADLQPGQRVLELAAGPGDTGFLAAELIEPGGTLVCSDASEAMLDVARERAHAFGVENVEFAVLQLEWIDLPAASVDATLCRWGVMLCVDPPAALKEIRRVLRPGGRVALAVWDLPELNPWMTMPGKALIDLELTAPPEPGEPGPFALSAPGQLAGLLDQAGFAEVVVDAVEIERTYESVDEYIGETRDLSMMFSDVYGTLDDGQRVEVVAKVSSLAEPYASGGALTLPGRSLVAAASA